MGHQLPGFARLQRGRLISNGLILACPFQDGSYNNNANGNLGDQIGQDFSGYQRHCSYIKFGPNAPPNTYGAGPVGGCINVFTGLNGVGLGFRVTPGGIGEPFNDMNLASGPGTMMCWANQTDSTNGTTQTIVAKWSVTNGRAWLWSFSVTGTAANLLFTYSNTGSASTANVTSSTTVNCGTWHHVAVTYDNTNFNCQQYIDGVNAGGGGSFASSVFNATASAVCVGCDKEGTDDGNIGISIADLRFYNRILSVDEITRVAAGLG